MQVKVIRRTHPMDKRHENTLMFFAFNLLKKKPSFTKCMILNLRFLKTDLLSEFHLYLGLMDTQTSSVNSLFP